LAVGHKKFKVHGKSRNKADIQYLRFGGNDSEVSVYLYNKTAELQEVKDKPWIRDFWAANEIDQTKTIWRLEFSIKGSRLRHVDNSTGLIDKFTIDSIDDYSFMIKFYYALLKRYFRFRINDGLSNISRMKQIELFAESSINNSIKIWNENFESDRSTKIFIKKIESFNNTIRQIKRQLNDNQLDSWFIGDQYMNQVLDLYDKHDFYERKIKEKV
jgi:hypothetical protein